MSMNSIHPPLLGYLLPKQRKDDSGQLINCSPRFEKSLSWTHNIHAGMDEHIVTIAPTGAGKGTACIIPNLLRNTGPAVVIDPKGENYLVTARTRRAMGHRVVLLDPFEVIETFAPGTITDSFNPMDVLRTAGGLLEEDAISMANTLITGRSQVDPFWDRAACNLIAGMLVHLKNDAPNPLQTLNELLYRLGGGPDDLRQSFGLTKTAHQSPFVQSMVGATVNATKKTRSSIQTVALSHCATFASTMVARATARTTFNLDDVIAGTPMTIYLVFPPENLHSHSALLRIWLACLIQLTTRRTHAPEQITTLFVDEAAQLGTLEELLIAATLLRGYGVRLWSFWQGLSQIENLYPKDWRTILNNSGTIQWFGNNHALAESELYRLGNPYDAEFCVTTASDEQILFRNDGATIHAQLIDYRTAPECVGLFDENPLYAKPPQSKSQHLQHQESREICRKATASATTGHAPSYNPPHRLER